MTRKLALSVMLVLLAALAFFVTGRSGILMVLTGGALVAVWLLPAGPNTKWIFWCVTAVFCIFLAATLYLVMLADGMAY